MKKLSTIMLAGLFLIISANAGDWSVIFSFGNHHNDHVRVKYDTRQKERCYPVKKERCYPTPRYERPKQCKTKTVTYRSYEHRTYEPYVEHRPRYISTYERERLVDCAIQKRQFSEAYRHLSILLECRYPKADHLYKMSLVSFKLNNNQDSIQSMRQLFALHPYRAKYLCRNGIYGTILSQMSCEFSRRMSLRCNTYPHAEFMFAAVNYIQGKHCVAQKVIKCAFKKGDTRRSTENLYRLLY